MGKTPKLKVVKINQSTEYKEWLEFRQNGIGGSEIGTIMGVNPWKSATELFYQKVGVIPQKVEQNMPMFMGTVSEDLVANCYQYYNGDEDMINNYYSGKKVRTLFEPVGYYVNPQYPMFFYSPDRIEVKKKPRVVNGNISFSSDDKVIEIKTINGWSSKQWDGGLPPSYYLQTQFYMHGLGLRSATIVALEDGRNWRVHNIEYDKDMCNKMVVVAQEFWERVELAREDIENADLYEPPVEGTPAYESFLVEQYKNPEENKKASNEEIDAFICSYMTLDTQIKELEDKKTFCGNHIKRYMENDSILDSEYAKVTWRKNARGNRIFRILEK